MTKGKPQIGPNIAYLVNCFSTGETRPPKPVWAIHRQTIPLVGLGYWGKRYEPIWLSKGIFSKFDQSRNFNVAVYFKRDSTDVTVLLPFWLHIMLSLWKKCNRYRIICHIHMVGSLDHMHCREKKLSTHHQKEDFRGLIKKREEIVWWENCRRHSLHFFRWSLF